MCLCFFSSLSAYRSHHFNQEMMGSTFVVVPGYIVNFYLFVFFPLIIKYEQVLRVTTQKTLANIIGRWSHLAFHLRPVMTLKGIPYAKRFHDDHPECKEFF